MTGGATWHSTPATLELGCIILLHNPGTCHHPLILRNTDIFLKWNTQLFTTAGASLAIINLITMEKKRHENNE